MFKVFVICYVRVFLLNYDVGFINRKVLEKLVNVELGIFIFYFLIENLCFFNLLFDILIVNIILDKMLNVSNGIYIVCYGFNFLWK